MKRNVHILLLSAILPMIMLACVHKSEDVQPVVPNTNTGVPGTGGNTTTDTALCFERDVLPIFIANCAKSGCHSGQDNNSAREGYVLNSYETISKSEDFRPYQPSKTKIFKVLRDDDDDRMPYKLPPLKDKEIDLIYRWILSGAENSTCRSSSSATPTFAASIQPLLNTNCISCHSTASPSKGVSLDNYNGVKAVATDGRLLGVIRHTPGYPQMPLNRAKLADADIAAIEKWVLAGALQN